MPSNDRRLRLRLSASVVALAVVLGSAACTDDADDERDVGAALFADEGVSDLYDTLVEGVGTSADYEGHAASAGHAIGSATNHAAAVLPDDPDAFAVQFGPAPSRYFRAVGSYLGSLASELDELAPAEREHGVAFALELGSSMSEVIEPEAEASDRLAWLLPTDVTLADELRSEVVDAMDAGDVERAARLLVEDAGIDGADVVETVHAELSGHVPVSPEHDLLADLLSGWQLHRDR